MIRKVALRTPNWLYSISAALAALTVATVYSLAQSPPAASGYVDPQTCAGCHAEIAKTYAQTGMGRSFYPATSLPANSLSKPYFHKPSESYFTLLQRDGKMFQRRHQLDPAGRPINILEKQIDYLMGSGNHAITFLHRTARNTLIELPLGWFAEKGGTLAMNPGYDRPDHEGFRRKVTYDCMFCHNGYPQLAPGQEKAFAEPVYPAALPQGIDCQRCHGPGRRHVQAAQSGAKMPFIRNAIVNPARLSPGLREEVCIQCHLETTSFPLPNSLPIYGKGPFDYRPGEPLSNHWLFFDHAPAARREDKFEIVNAVYRIRRSKCFLESGDKLQCTTCHNPHDVPRGARATAHYDAACRQCHSTAFNTLVTAGKHTPSADCAGCHMPKRRTEDVVHSLATDHRIQRRPPPGDLLAEIPERHESGDKAYRGEVVLYYPQKLPSSPAAELYLALAQVIQKSNLPAGTPRLATAVQRHTPTQPEFQLELAEAWRSSGQHEKEISAYREALRLDPTSSVALQKLGAALSRSGKQAEAVATLKRSLAIDPANASTWHELGLAHRAQSNLPEALTALKKSVALDPDMPALHSNLGIVLAASGDQSAAATSFREAIRLQPDYADAHNNLANLLAAAGDFPAARTHFEIALRLRPADAPTRYNFAMALGRARLFDEAQQQLEAALRADPAYSDARHRLAEMLMAKGQVPAAIPHYRELVRLQPDSGPALLGLGAALAMSGDVNGGLPHLRKAAASPDASVREQAADILRQIGPRP